MASPLEQGRPEESFVQFQNVIHELLKALEPTLFQEEGIKGGLIVPESAVTSLTAACASLRTRPENYGFMLLQVGNRVFLVTDGSYTHKSAKNVRLYALNAIQTKTMNLLLNVYPQARINQVDPAWRTLSAEEYWEERWR